MPTLDDAQRGQQEKDDVCDWHPADVLAALKKRGLTLSGLSTANGYHPTAAGKALKQPWPALEHLIAGALGIPPGMIWPTRYPQAEPAADGKEKPEK